MATSKVVVTEAERKVICEALHVHADVFKRAARSEKDVAIAELRMKAENTCRALSAKLSTGELEF